MKYVLAYSGKEVSRHSTLDEAIANVLCFGDRIFDAEEYDRHESGIMPIMTGKEALDRKGVA